MFQISFTMHRLYRNEQASILDQVWLESQVLSDVYYIKSGFRLLNKYLNIIPISVALIIYKAT